jgi:CubicO group peptidase (beta-lactamase class C family)
MVDDSISKPGVNNESKQKYQSKFSRTSRRGFVIGSSLLGLGITAFSEPSTATSDNTLDCECELLTNPDHDLWPEPSNPYKASVVREQYEHSLARKAKKVCSAVFLTDRDPWEFIDNDLRDYRTQYFDYDDVEIEVDKQDQLVNIYANGTSPKRSKFNKTLGATILPPGATDVGFDPIEINPDLPDPNEANWPIGDRNATHSPTRVDQDCLDDALNWAWETTTPGTVSEYAETRAVVVVHDGKIVAERYETDFDKNSLFKSWSMGKSTVATLIGILAGDGHFDVNDPAPVDEWYKDDDDPRQAITIKDLLQMSSGLRFNHSDQPDTIHMTKNDDHQRGYITAHDQHEFCANQSLEYEPGTNWAYRNVNPYLLDKIVKETVRNERDEEYIEFPQRSMYDKIGVRNAVHEVSMRGHFVFPGFNHLTARDWTRFGLMYLQEGTIAGNKVFPEWWIDVVTEPAPALVEEGTPEYGGQFWLNKDESLHENVPEDTYIASGAQSNWCIIIPSADIVITRLGREAEYDRGEFIRRILEAFAK